MFSAAVRNNTGRLLSATKAMQRRGMAGGYPASMAVKKNKYVEEWNGKREITERSFSMDYDKVPTLVFYLMLVPYGIYTWSRSELINSGDRRYQKIV